MSKHYIDRNRWKEPFFKAYSREAKLLFDYILDHVDGSGIWFPDHELIFLQTKIGPNEVAPTMAEMKNELFPTNEANKFFLPYHLVIQFGKINVDSKMGKNIYNKLKKLGIEDYIIKDIFVHGSEPIISAAVEEEREEVIEHPFKTEHFVKQWDLWKKYLREGKHKFVYDFMGEQAALQDLGEQSGNDEITAIKLIKDAMRRGWKSLNNFKNQYKPKTKTDDIRDLVVKDKKKKNEV